MMVLAPRHFTESLASSLIYTTAPYITGSIQRSHDCHESHLHSVIVVLLQLQTEAHLRQALKHDADVLGVTQM